MLTMQSIRKSFAGVEVLHGVDFAIRPGEVHALVGHNGAGKSTLMEVLGGSYPDYSGEIAIDGIAQDIRTPRASLEAGIAIIHQDFALVPELDVAHNIALGREPAGRTRATIAHGDLARRSAQEAQRFGIALPMRTPVGRLGVADQQLTEIVRALARDVRYLVMDEPTARLAPAERAQLFTIIRSLAAQGVGIVYISHFLDEVIDIGNRVTVLRDGVVVAERPTAQCTADRLAAELVGEREAEVVQAARPTAAQTSTRPARLTARGIGVGRGNLSLTVDGGEIVALAGLVGSGRTRLARALIGDLKVAGEVAVDGRPIRRRNPAACARAGLVLVPEDRKRSGLVLTGSVRDNIELTALGTGPKGGLARRGIVRFGAVNRIVAALLTRFRVRPHDPTALVTNLSGGNAQKVLFARTVAADPKAVIFDQPTAGVDVGAKAELHAQVASMAQAGAAVLVISDDLDEMLELADRVLVLAAGTISHDLAAGQLDRATLLSVMSRTEATA